MTPAEKQIAQLYIGYFNRAPDREGHDYWVARFNDGMSLVDIAESFFVQPEAVAIYGGLGRGPLIDMIYANLFRRAPDAAGKDYWMNNGQPVGRMIVDIISGAQGGDLHLLELLTGAAGAWMASYPQPFDMAHARLALSTVLNWDTPAGANVTIKSPELLPYENILVPAIKRAWLQWGIAGSCEIELHFMPDTAMTGIIASALPCQELHTGDSGVEYEAQTGLDPNGMLADGRIYIKWADIQDMLNRFDLESWCAHEIGHFFFRLDLTGPGNSFTRLMDFSGGQRVLTGPHILAAYGGAIPLYTDANNYPLPHVADDRMLMYPWHTPGRRVTAWDKAVLRDMGVPVT